MSDQPAVDARSAVLPPISRAYCEFENDAQLAYERYDRDYDELCREHDSAIAKMWQTSLDKQQEANQALRSGLAELATRAPEEQSRAATEAHARYAQSVEAVISAYHGDLQERCEAWRDRLGSLATDAKTAVDDASRKYIASVGEALTAAEGPDTRALLQLSGELGCVARETEAARAFFSSVISAVSRSTAQPAS